jgi:hypothetical protein
MAVTKPSSMVRLSATGCSLRGVRSQRSSSSGDIGGLIMPDVAALRLAGGSCSGLQRLRGAGGLPDPGQELMQLMLVWTAPDGISVPE